MSLVEMMVAMGISSIVLFGTSQVITFSSNTNSNAQRLFWLSARRVELQSLIRSADGWAAIVAQNPGTNCFTSTAAAGCIYFSNPQFLKIPINGIVVNGGSPTTGMTDKGDFCTTFDPVHGNRECPIGVQMRWEALCDNNVCQHAQPKVTIRFQLKEPGSGALTDLKSYDLTVFRDAKLEALNETCLSMGGTLVGISCDLPQLTTTCDPATGNFVLGFDAVGRVICGKPQPGACGADDVGVGFNSAGGVQCAPACR